MSQAAKAWKLAAETWRRAFNEARETNGTVWQTTITMAMAAQEAAEREELLTQLRDGSDGQ